MINPLLQESLASIVRHVLTIGAGYLVAQGIWTQEAAVLYVSAAALGIVAIGWGLWQKYASRTKLVTALALPSMTEAAVEQKIAAGQSASASTAKASQAVAYSSGNDQF